MSSQLLNLKMEIVKLTWLPKQVHERDYNLPVCSVLEQYEIV